MKRTAGFVISLLALLTLAFVTSTKAETVQAALLLSPANEVPPVTGIAASGAFQITVTVTRDTNGAITGGSVRFLGNVSFPGNVIVTGLHIHEGSATVAAGVVINTGLSGSNTMTFASGVGIIDLTVQ